MAFGWFAKGKNDPARLLQKAHKLVTQARWAEALSYYQEAMDAPESATEAREGARACREKLVQWNLEEAESFRVAEDPDRAREHVELARELAGEEEDLRARVRSALEAIPPDPPAGARGEEPRRMFESRCGCGTPCPTGGGAAEEHVAGEELFEFYLDSTTPAERAAFEELDADFRQGFVLLQQGETASARPLLEAVAADRDDIPGPRYALGLLAAIEGLPSEARKHFSRTLEIDPDFAPAAHHMADLLREEGRGAEAAEFLGPWCAAHAEDTEAHYLLALCLAETGDRPGALDALERARDSASGHHPRLEILGASILERNGEADAALEAYQGVVARNPNLLEALVPLGRLLLQRGGSSAEKAAELFKHCRRLDPERGWWYLLRVAEAYAARGWHEEARDLLASSVQELPDAPEPRAEWSAVQKSLEG